MWRKIILYSILLIFFIENIEVDSLTLWRVEYLHSKAERIRENLNDLSNLQHFMYDSETMTRVNNHEVIIDGQYYDIIKEDVTENGHHLYCKLDKEEGFLLKLVSWIKDSEKQDQPYNTSKMLKSKLKSLKYLKEKPDMSLGFENIASSNSEAINRSYQSPSLKIPVPPPIC